MTHLLVIFFKQANLKIGSPFLEFTTAVSALTTILSTSPYDIIPIVMSMIMAINLTG